jgi:tetratricopeptide (TPR) repeat protein
MRQGRPSEESLPHVERALELSDDASPVERAFIRATYHAVLGSLGGPEAHAQLDEAVAQYRTLLELDPSHFWAGGNLAVLLDDLGRGSEAVNVLAKAADTHHRNNAARQRMAAWFVVRYDGEVERARRYLDRAAGLAELAEPTGSHFYGLGKALEESLGTHELWLAGDLDGLVTRLRENVERTPALTGYLRSAVPGITTMHMVDLGMFRRASEVVDLYGGWSPEEWERFLSLRRQDFERLREILPQDPAKDPVTTTARALDLANVGLLEEAETLLEDLPDELSPGARGNIALVRGTAELARGRPRQAVSLLSDAVNTLVTQDYLAPYFMAALQLARAWQEIGYPERAARLLEEASQQRDRLIRGARFYWMRIELQRAELYRTVGRNDEAAEVEARLWLLCSYADPDFPILRELERRQDPPPLG